MSVLFLDTKFWHDKRIKNIFCFITMLWFLIFYCTQSFEFHKYTILTAVVIWMTKMRFFEEIFSQKPDWLNGYVILRLDYCILIHIIDTFKNLIKSKRHLDLKRRVSQSFLWYYQKKNLEKLKINEDFVNIRQLFIFKQYWWIWTEKCILLRGEAQCIN